MPGKNAYMKLFRRLLFSLFFLINAAVFGQSVYRFLPSKIPASDTYLFYLQGRGVTIPGNNAVNPSQSDSFLAELFAGNTDSIFQEVIDHPSTYRLQIIYTQIDRDKDNRPAFRDYHFNLVSESYFNPASTVKLPLALLSLEKINALKVPGLDKFTPVQFDSAFTGQQRKLADTTSENGFPSIGHFIKKAFLVSDNDAYTRMYEFVGQRDINRVLHSKGYRDVRITHRFVRMTPEENRHTNPLRFIAEDGSLIYAQPAAYNGDRFDAGRAEQIGIAHYDNDSLINAPMDFSMRNRLPLDALHQMLRSVMFPESVPEAQRFNLTVDDYVFLHQYLSQFPGETNYPKYDTSQYFDSYVKFFFRDSLHHKLPEGVRVFNKVGWSYGFMIDASYVADFRNKVEFLLSATLYANSDGVVNDNRYDYKSVSHPFLYQLGQTIYRYELRRNRRFMPDLTQFKIPYEKRLNDKRHTVKDVDN
ncbi:MAG TPA: serine hydrolase [Cyclobacteriaceae bacterium]